MSTLQIIAWCSLAIGILSFIVLYVDINMGRYQHMPIMNICWPITALYLGPVALYMYYKYGRSKDEDHEHKNNKKKPSWVNIYISSTHCGAGCSLADIVSESLIYFAGILVLGKLIWTSFFLDYGFALVFGLVFQYYNIAPMSPDLSRWEILKKAFKADYLSLTSFQAGMYGWLLAVHYMFQGGLNASNPIYWFMMQIGLSIGLLTTCPVNAWLIHKKIKMPCAH